MLSIRLQRTGRKGFALYRMIAQESHRHPSSGKVAAYLGNIDPHAKKVEINKDQIEKYLANGAQPSDRVARILKSEGMTLPKWYKDPATKQRTVRNTEKLRKHRPAAEVPEEVVVVEDAPAPAEVEQEAPVEEAPVEEAATSDEAPVEEPASTDESPVVEETETEAVADSDAAADESPATETAPTEEPKKS